MNACRVRDQRYRIPGHDIQPLGGNDPHDVATHVGVQVRFKAGRFDERYRSGKPGLPVSDSEVLRPQAIDDFRTRPRGGARRNRQGQIRPGIDDGTRFALRDRARDEVHGRRTEEIGHEHGRRSIVELERRTQLLDPAIVHDHHEVRHGHGLDLVVRDVDRRAPETLVQRLDLGAHLDPELRIEVRERFVEQEQFRLPDERPAHRHPLALAARELSREALEKGIEIQDAGGRFDPGLLHGIRRLGHLEAEGEVLPNRHVGIERIRLEHHGDPAVLRGNPIDDPPAHDDGAGRHRLEAGDHAQQGRLAAAGGSYEDDEGVLLDRQFNPVQDLERPKALAKVVELHERRAH